MKTQNPKVPPQKLTSEFAADLQAKWSERGKEILDKLCDEAPTKLVETLGKLAVAERLSPVETIDFNSAQSMREIGLKLLQSIGFSNPDENSIQEAVELNDTFIDGLQRIYQRAQASENGEIH